MDFVKCRPFVEKAMEGDKQAYAELCELIIRDVLYICIKITGDLHNGEDAAQEALLSFATAIRKLKNPQAFPLWLNRCISNSCRDYMKKERRSMRYFSDENLEDMIENNLEFLPEQWVEKEDMRRTVVSALQKLPARQQHILLMYYFQDMTTKDIAAAHKISEATARSNLRYARGNLKRAIEKQAKTRLPAFAASGSVPALTIILNMDAALLVNEESIHRVLSALGAALAGGALAVGTAGAASVSFVAMATAATPVAVSLVAGAALLFGSSPSPSVSAASVFDELPQASEMVAAQAEPEGEGDLYIDSIPDDLYLPSSSALSPPAAAATENPVFFEASGQVRLAGDFPAEEVDLSGLVVEAYDGQRLVAHAMADAAGVYTLCLPAGTQAYTLQVAQTPKPSLGPQNAQVQFSQGQSEIPPLYVTDGAPPECGALLLDADAAPTDTNPAFVEIVVADVLPCTVAWKLYTPYETGLVSQGEGQRVPLQALQLPAGGYTLEIRATDSAGNFSVTECQLYFE